MLLVEKSTGIASISVSATFVPFLLSQWVNGVTPGLEDSAPRCAVSLSDRISSAWRRGPKSARFLQKS
jgi:hypothetical protein